MVTSRALWSSILVLLLVDSLVAQQPALQVNPGQEPTRVTLPNAAEQLRPTYKLGPGDQILIRSAQTEDLNEKAFTIDANGDITLPLIGKIHAADQTVAELEAQLTERLKVYVRAPLVKVIVTNFRSEPVFLVGAFKTPGIYPLQGRKTLIEVLTLTGGLQPNSSRRIKLTRRLVYGRIPLPNAVDDTLAEVSTVEINLGSLKQSVNPAEDIVLQPYDLLTVERAEMVYVNGEVTKVGGYELGERDSISVTQLISLAGGLSRDAAADKALILRPVLNTSRRAEIPLNLKKVLSGKDNDFPLAANDLLYIPRSGTRSALRTIVLPVALGMAGTVIYVVAARK